MENNFQTAIASVQNMPKEKTDRYLVARLNMNLLWYWGSWDTKEAAERVAEQFENGVVVERITGNKQGERMSVITKGMDLPKACIDCEYSRCHYYKVRWCQESDLTSNYKNSRGIFCPLEFVKGLIEKIKECAEDKTSEEQIGIEYAIDTIKEYCEIEGNNGMEKF